MSQSIGVVNKAAAVTIVPEGATRCCDCERKRGEAWAKAFNEGIAMLLASGLKKITITVVKAPSKTESGEVILEFK